MTRQHLKKKEGGVLSVWEVVSPYLRCLQHLRRWRGDVTTDCSNSFTKRFPECDLTSAAGFTAVKRWVGFTVVSWWKQMWDGAWCWFWLKLRLRVSVLLFSRRHNKRSGNASVCVAAGWAQGRRLCSGHLGRVFCLYQGILGTSAFLHRRSRFSVVFLIIVSFLN